MEKNSRDIYKNMKEWEDIFDVKKEKKTSWLECFGLMVLSFIMIVFPAWILCINFGWWLPIIGIGITIGFKEWSGIIILATAISLLFTKKHDALSTSEAIRFAFEKIIAYGFLTLFSWILLIIA